MSSETEVPEVVYQSLYLFSLILCYTVLVIIPIRVLRYLRYLFSNTLCPVGIFHPRYSHYYCLYSIITHP